MRCGCEEAQTLRLAISLAFTLQLRPKGPPAVLRALARSYSARTVATRGDRAAFTTFGPPVPPRQPGARCCSALFRGSSSGFGLWGRRPSSGGPSPRCGRWDRHAGGATCPPRPPARQNWLAQRDRALLVTLRLRPRKSLLGAACSQPGRTGGRFPRRRPSLPGPARLWCRMATSRSHRRREVARPGADSDARAGAVTAPPPAGKRPFRPPSARDSMPWLSMFPRDRARAAERARQRATVPRVAV